MKIHWLQCLHNEKKTIKCIECQRFHRWCIDQMHTKEFGETGVSVAAIGLGTTRMGTKTDHSEEYVKQRIQSLQLGIDLGMTFIDTASLYGNGFAEEVVGKALKGRRENCFLATKILSEKTNEISRDSYWVRGQPSSSSDG